MYIYVYLHPLSHRYGDIRRYSWIIETLTDGRKKIGVIKGLCERKLYREDSVTMKTTISPNPQISMKL